MDNLTLLVETQTFIIQVLLYQTTGYSIQIIKNLKVKKLDIFLMESYLKYKVNQNKNNFLSLIYFFIRINQYKLILTNKEFIYLNKSYKSIIIIRIFFKKILFLNMIIFGYMLKISIVFNSHNTYQTNYKILIFIKIKLMV